MKLKIAKWGNSHGIRLPQAIMEHLNAHGGEDIDVNFTNTGVEISKKDRTDYLIDIEQQILESQLAQTQPVKRVNDPYAETDVAYSVIPTHSQGPLIREVPKDTKNAFATLAEAKEAARQQIQASIVEARKLLTELRQLGIDNIRYISL